MLSSRHSVNAAWDGFCGIMSWIRTGFQKASVPFYLRMSKLLCVLCVSSVLGSALLGTNIPQTVQTTGAAATLTHEKMHLVGYTQVLLYAASCLLALG